MKKKQEILGAAYRIFQRHGYRRTNVEDIAKAVGIRKSGLYYYFENKEDLFIQTFMGEWVEKLETFCARLNQEPNIRKRIQSFTKGNFREVAAVVNQFGASVESILENRTSFGKEIHCQIEEMRTAFYRQCIQEGIEQGLFRPVNPVKAAKMILGATNSIEFTALSLLDTDVPSDQDLKKIEGRIMSTLNVLLDGLTNPTGQAVI